MHVMTRTTALLLITGAVLEIGATRARVDFDHNRQFSRYKTYSWIVSPNGQPAGGLFPNQIMRERIVEFIEGALAARGYKRLDSKGDLLVSFDVQVTEQPVYTTIGDGWGGGWGWGWGPGWNSGISTTVVDTIYHGTLVVELRDARQNQLVFQGTSTHTISSRPARNSKKLANAVDEIFEKYPPQQ